jgi:hypothetical protein
MKFSRKKKRMEMRARVVQKRVGSPWSPNCESVIVRLAGDDKGLSTTE